MTSYNGGISRLAESVVIITINHDSFDLMVSADFSLAGILDFEQNFEIIGVG